MHICVSKLTIIGSYNGLSPGRRQAIIWTNAGILLIRTSGTNFSEIFSEIHTFSFKKMHLSMSSVKWRQFCLCLNVLTHLNYAGKLGPCLLQWLDFNLTAVEKWQKMQIYFSVSYMMMNHKPFSVWRSVPWLLGPSLTDVWLLNLHRYSVGHQDFSCKYK